MLSSASRRVAPLSLGRGATLSTWAVSQSVAASSFRGQTTIKVMEQWNVACHFGAWQGRLQGRVSTSARFAQSQAVSALLHEEPRRTAAEPHCLYL